MSWTKEELLQLIIRGEGYDLEYKETFSNRIAREICAFANASGGNLLLGVSDRGEIKGISITNSLKSNIHDIAHNLDPSLEISLHCIDNVLIVQVPEGRKKPYSANGKFFLRYGTNTQQLGREDIRNFFQEEGFILFDEKLNLDFDLEKDFNLRQFKFFLEKAKITFVLRKAAILENLQLTKEGIIKNAGVLLFCKKVSKFFNQATITCVLYQGKNKYKILDRKEFEDDLYTNYLNVMIYMQSKLNTELIIKGGLREERLELPEEALREALLNSISHRNYFVSGTNIIVEIFSDRVEITNPGGLVKGITIEDLGRKSLSRNNLLFGLLQRMGLVEKVGSGILRINSAMKEYGIKDPRFEINPNWFTIILDRKRIEKFRRGSEKSSEKSSEKIIKLMIENQSVSAKNMASIIGISPRAVEKHIFNLKEKGIVKRIGSSKKGYWEVKKDNK